MSRGLAAVLVGALASAALAVQIVGTTAPPAEAAGGAVYIDEPLQAGALTGWTLQGAGNLSTAAGSTGGAWTPRLSTVAQNNALFHSINTNGCGVGTTANAWPLCTATFDGAHDSRWLTLTTDNTNNGAGQAGTALHDTSFPSDLGVVLEYDQRVYRTNNGRLGGTPANQGGGDGIAVYLVDASPENHGDASVDITPGEAGGYGAGLGYSSVSNTGDAWCPAQQGVTGGYLGVGFDVYGNYQKAEKAEGFGQYHRATRPYAVSLGNADAFTGVDASVRSSRIPQSIGLRGSGVRYSTTPSCSSAGTGAMNRAYGLVSTTDPLVTTAGVRTVFQVKWTAGDAASAYTGQYQPNGQAAWTTVPAQEVPDALLPAGFTDPRGYVRFEVPDAVGAFSFRYAKAGNPTTAAFPNLTTDSSLGNAPAYTPLTRSVGGYRWLAGTANLSAYPNPTTTARVSANDAALRGAVIDNTATDAGQYRRVRITLTPAADGTRKVSVFWTDKLSTADDRCYDANGAEIPEVSTTGGVDECVASGGTWRHPGPYSFDEQFSYDLASSPYQADLPDSFRLGFSASTGWAVDYHQIRNLRVTSVINLAVQKTVQSTGSGAAIDDAAWADAATVRAGENVAYRIAAVNRGPSDLDAQHPASLTDGLGAIPFADPAAVTWTATATGDARICDGWSGATHTCANWVTSLTGTGPIADADALRWHANAASGDAVEVVFQGTLDAAAAPADYPNTATVTADPAGPQESDLTDNQDDAVITVLPGWTLSKTADPASGSEVAAGQTITYTVTATAPAAGAAGTVAGATITDSLGEVAPYADFVAGSVLVDGQTPAAPVVVTEPDPGNGQTLTVAGITIPGGAAVKITYAVTVRQDAPPRSTLHNSVTGTAPGNPPTQCADPAEPDFALHCATVHRTPALLQVLKVGETADGTVVPFDGSEWGVYPDAAGEPDFSTPLVEFGPAPKTPAIDTGLFRGQLPSGTYWLREEKALDGFALLPEPVQFTVAADGTVSIRQGDSDWLAACPADPAASLCDLVPADHGDVPTIVVRDVPRIDLPEAGGAIDPRVFAFAGIGILLAAGAVVLLLRRRAVAVDDAAVTDDVAEDEDGD